MLKNSKKRIIPFIVIALVIAMAGTALADSYTDQWSSFPLTMKSSNTVYNTYGVQNWLRMYSAYTRTQIMGAGGTDGSFGTTTENMVKYFQTMAGGLTIDGKVGSNTWDAMSDRLTYTHTSGGDRYYESYCTIDTGRIIYVLYDPDWWESQRDSDDRYRHLGG